VVKNVAGYDLCKLFTGSYGTLCLILELTFKLRPLPGQTTTIAAQGSIEALLRSARAILDARLLPVAVELLSSGVAQKLAISHEDEDASLLIRYAGTPETVVYQTEQTVTLLRGEQAHVQVATLNEDAEYWRGLAALPMEPTKALSWRAALLPTELEMFLNRAMKEGGAAFSSSSLWHAGVADGRLRVMNTTNDNAVACATALKRLRAETRGTLVIENAPQEIKDSIDAWGDFGSKTSLMRRVKQELDPNGLFSPGRFFGES
ncbi:MAG TPA: FAD-linked oxidase C-terminal domain-containing protein, partial [Pyrinomonadaceae bacterium]